MGNPTMIRSLITTVSLLAFAGIASAQGARLGTSCVEQENVKGAVIERVAENSPAHSIGLAPGDVIIKLDGTDITDLDSFTKTFDSLKPGQDVTVVWRKGGAAGEVTEAKVKLGKLRAEQAGAGAVTPTERANRLTRIKQRAAERARGGEHESADAVVAVPESHSAQVVEARKIAYLGVVTKEEGQSLVVAEAIEGSAAEKCGLRPGDEIVSVADKVAATQTELREVIRSHKPGEKIDIHIRRDGKEMKLEAALGELMEAGIVTMSPGVGMTAPEGEKIQIFQGSRAGAGMAGPAGGMGGVPAPMPPRDSMAGNVMLQNEIATLRVELTTLRAELAMMREQLAQLQELLKKQRKEK